jgi:hypothetical protein
VHAALEFDAVGPAHFDIDKGGVPRFFCEFGERAVGVFGRPDFVSFFVEPFGKRVAHAQFVVDNQEL